METSAWMAISLACPWAVSTLPIRNGNCVPNLYKRYSGYNVSTLPIRNGNKHSLQLVTFLICLRLVSTLPIRNGNLLTCRIFICFCLSVITLPIRNTPSYLGWDNKITTRSKRGSLLLPMMWSLSEIPRWWKPYENTLHMNSVRYLRGLLHRDD